MLGEQLPQWFWYSLGGLLLISVAIAVIFLSILLWLTSIEKFFAIVLNL